MSEGNVELVRTGLGSWNGGDLDAMSDTWDEHIVMRSDESWPEAVYYGKEAVRSFFAGFAETVGGEAVIEDLIDAGDSVVVRIRTHYSGEQSGVEGNLVSSQVVTFRKGKVILIEFFLDHQQALEAAGLSEDPS